MVLFQEWSTAARQAIAAGDHSASGPLGVASALHCHIHDLVTAAKRDFESQTNRQAKRPRLVPNWKAAAPQPTSAVPEATYDSANAKLLRFMRLLHHLNKAPWSNVAFGPNQSIMHRLVASHIKIITGAKRPHPSLYTLINSKEAGELATINNLVWITNRQQGKTTTLGKFIAAIAIASTTPGGTLACVYSTKLDRAAELLRAAKEYLYWMQTDKGRFAEFNDIEFTRDNANMFEISVNGGPAQAVMARPKNADTCRGDAFYTGFFDEAAFTSKDFWYKFALPLLQIRGRVFTCCTTPPPARGFFDVFTKQVIAANNRGEFFFQLINHSLSCAACIEANDGPRCTHRLWLIPPWKPILALSSISNLMGKAEAATYAAEVFGVLSGKFRGYLPEDLVNAALLQQRPAETNPYPKGTVPTVWCGIDPASHNVSDLGIAAIMCYSGRVYIIAAATISAMRCQVVELQAAVAMVLDQIRSHPWVDPKSPIIPIVECNNNEILAHSIVKVFETKGPTFQPFTKKRFQKNISDGIGVWTTEANKAASLQICYQLLLETRLSVSCVVAVADGTAWDTRAKRSDGKSMIKLLAEQLSAFSDDNKTGNITGKIDGAQDDLGMAFLMAVYWRLAVMHADPSVTDV